MSEFDEQMSELDMQLKAWSLADGSLPSEAAGRLISKLIDSVYSDNASNVWRNISQELALQLLELDGENYGWPIERLAPVLDKIEPYLDNDNCIRSHWRALRMLAKFPPWSVFEDFCRDLLCCEGTCEYGNAMAVVKAVLTDEDGRYRRALEKLHDGMLPGDQARSRLSSILDRA